MKKQDVGHIPMGLITRAMQIKHVIPVSVCLAQSIVEGSNRNYSDGKWLDSSLAVQHNNIFGHKWSINSIASGKIKKSTREWKIDQNGKKYANISVETFATYANLDMAFADHSRIMSLYYYDHARAYLRTPDEYAKRLSGIYSTDPDYDKALISVMRRYNLYKYDTKKAAPKPSIGDKTMGALLAGKKKFFALFGGFVGVVVNHFVLGVPDPRIDSIVVALTVAYQAFETVVDVVRSWTDRSNVKSIEAKLPPEVV